MFQPRALIASFGTATAALGACTPQAEMPEERGQGVVYQGFDTISLGDDLVSLSVRMTDAGSEQDVEDYARCAAAQYALDKGFGFARNVRTYVTKDGAEWYGDAVYLVSAELPQSQAGADAATIVSGCRALGIPTV